MLKSGDDCEDRIAGVEYDFKYKDLECFITLSKFGWRCAYIKLPKGHKYHGRQPQSLCFIDCHGGITFAGTSNICISTTNDEWIIGWDYNHLYDSYDWDAVEALFGPGTVADVKRRYYVSNVNNLMHKSKLYTVDDIADEIRYIIDKYEL